ncbi:C-type cytochrome, putative [Sulfurimonas denitrificans DSM 1251]|uniref:C-type cytochrome, putative n=2 Tax=Sulfurimonas denitrificans TaxID=39766 RepID=Q30TK4_SULDN|nr:C-type cytochrome, putative [Sulfurimonas denitrificans DSM 1251]
MGSLLFHGNCVTCHHETKTISAPSATEFRQRYRDAFSSKEEFVSYMSSWVKKPSHEGSLMHDAIKKHELMPELGFDEDALKIICAYIYDTNFVEEEKTHPKR